MFTSEDLQRLHNVLREAVRSIEAGFLPVSPALKKVAVVGNAEEFNNLIKLIGATIVGAKDLQWKGHLMIYVDDDTLYDCYAQFDYILFVGNYLGPQQMKIIDRIYDQNNRIEMMTPMYIIERLLNHVR